MIQVRKEKTNTSTSKRRRQWHPTQVLLPGKFHGQRSLVGCSPWGCQELDRTKRVHFHLSLSCIGEGNGNPRQCSCLENPRDGEAWWVAVCGVAAAALAWNSTIYHCQTWHGWALSSESCWVKLRCWWGCKLTGCQQDSIPAAVGLRSHHLVGCRLL